MSPTSHLAAINFFVGDIQGGLGPFLSTWLAQALHWAPERIGWISTVVGLATLSLNGPAGALTDRLGRPRLLLALACGGILVGTLLLLVARSVVTVILAEFLAAAGGTLVLPALTSFTLGIVGKGAFPHQQGRNQAFTHGGVLTAAVLIIGGTRLIGPGIAFVVLGAMSVAAIAAVVLTPARAWNGRRALGWKEDEPDETDRSHPLLRVLANRRLLFLAGALSLFALGNGTMLSLVSQRLVAAGHDATAWTAGYVMVAQVSQIPVALWAGSLADKRGRRHLLLIACAALVARAILTASFNSPYVLIGAEVLDGLGSGLLGVAVPVLVADMTWGSGRTQTAFGVVNTLQGIGGSLSGLFGGLLVHQLGWVGAFVGLGVPAAAAFVVALWLEETREMGTPFGSDEPAPAPS